MEEQTPSKDFPKEDARGSGSHLDRSLIPPQHAGSHTARSTFATLPINVKEPSWRGKKNPNQGLNLAPNYSGEDAAITLLGLEADRVRLWRKLVQLDKQHLMFILLNTMLHKMVLLDNLYTTLLFLLLKFNSS